MVQTRLGPLDSTKTLVVLLHQSFESGRQAASDAAQDAAQAGSCLTKVVSLLVWCEKCHVQIESNKQLVQLPVTHWFDPQGLTTVPLLSASTVRHLENSAGDGKINHIGFSTTKTKIHTKFMVVIVMVLHKLHFYHIIMVKKVERFCWPTLTFFILSLQKNTLWGWPGVAYLHHGGWRSGAPCVFVFPQQQYFSSVVFSPE